MNDEQDKSVFDMYGLSGLARYGTVSRVYEEFLRELQGPQGMKSLREMYDNDPIVGAIMYAANHLCRKVSFKFRPANSSAEATQIASQIGSMVFDDMDSAWPDTLSEILTMLPFGWSLLEFQLKRRLGMDPTGPEIPVPAGAPQDSINVGLPDSNTAQIGTPGYPLSRLPPSRFDDGLIGFRSWSLRSQETIYMWEFDEQSNAVVMQQMAPPDYKIRRIPLSKALLFRTQVAKNNPEGRSILRNAWTSYYFKKNLQVFEGIGIERDLAGYPVITIQPSDLQKGQVSPDLWNKNNPDGATMLDMLKKIVRSVRRDEQEGIVLPWWAKFELLGTGSRRTFDTNAIIGRYDQRIAMSVMADFIMLGHEAVGSKALAETKISLFTSALSSFLDTVCAIINRHAVVMIMRMNGWDQKIAPVMEHGDVESVNLDELGNFIQKIAQTGFNPLASYDAQKSTMEAAKLPTTGLDPDPTKNMVVQNDPNLDNRANPSSGVGDSKEDKGGVKSPSGPLAPSESLLGPLATLETT